MMCTLAAAALTSTAGLLVWAGPASVAEDKKDPPKPMTTSRGPVVLTDEALQLQRDSLVWDGHNDLPWQFREKATSRSRSSTSRSRRRGCTPTSRACARAASAPSSGRPTSPPKPPRRARPSARPWKPPQQIDIIKRMVKAYPDTFEMAYTADDVVRIHKEGKIASLIGMEGGHRSTIRWACCDDYELGSAT